MTVPYNVKPITNNNNPFKTLNNALDTFFGGKPKTMKLGKFTPPKIKHEMPTLPGLENWPSDYVLSESHIKPVEATTIELGYEIDRLERELEHQKINFEQYHHASNKLIDELKEYEVKFKNSEFANKNLQAKLDKLEGTEQYSLWLMKQHLQMKEQLASVEDKGMGRSEWI